MGCRSGYVCELPVEAGESVGHQNTLRGVGAGGYCYLGACEAEFETGCSVFVFS